MYIAVSVVGLLLATLPHPGCRCLSKDHCFAQVPFHELNSSLNGKLVEVRDEMDSCFDDIHSKKCTADLQQTDDEFFYTNQVGGYMHTGLATSWNIAHRLAS